MPSFAEGLAKSLLQQQVLDQQDTENRRKDAIALASLQNNQEEMEWKRKDRERDDATRKELEDNFNNFYNKEVEEPIEGALPDVDGKVPTRKVRKTFQMGDRTSLDGIKRDMGYMQGLVSILSKNGKITPEVYAKSMDHMDGLERNGIASAAARLLVNPDDANAQKILANKFGVDPNGKLGFEMTNKTPDGKDSLMPNFFLTYTDANGQQQRKDVTPSMIAMNIATFADIQKNAVALQEKGAAIEQHNATAAKDRALAAEVPANAKAERAQRYAQAKRDAAAADNPTKGSDHWNTFTQRLTAEEKFFKVPGLYVGFGDKKKSMPDEGAAGIINQFGEVMIGAGIKGAQAYSQSKAMLEEANRLAMEGVKQKAKDARAQAVREGKGTANIDAAENNPDWVMEGFNNLRKYYVDKGLANLRRQLEQIQQQQQPAGRRAAAIQ